MKSFFPNQLSQEDLQHRLAQRRARNITGRTQSMSQINEDTMELTGTMGDTLDDIMQNNMEIQRRQSLPRGYSPQDMDQRSSMMEFGSNTGPLNGFQFGTPTSSAADPNIRRQSVGELDLTRFADIPPGMNLTPQQMGFSPMQPQNALTINTNNHFSNIPGDMMQNMMGYTSMGMGHVSEEETADLNMNMTMFSPAGYQNPYGGGNLESMQNDFMMPSNDGLPSQASGMRPSDSTGNEAMQTMPNLNLSEASMGNSPHNSGMNQNMASFSSTPAASLPTVQSTRESSYNIAAPTPSASAPDTEAAIKTEPKYHGIYSSSGFDMLGALMKVATRKQPEIEIGKVDMSCAFVVCDITQYDCPIIYISDVFERLTGYSKHEVKGQNCRFLQSPEGKVEAGTKREFTENESVHYLRTRIAEKKEAQRSLVNYRKGGQPFINLLTMIPITGEDDKTIKYYVGFQVDLVAKPTSLEGQNAAGMYHVDYSQSHLPRYVWQPPEGVRPSDGGQTISRDDVSTVLSSMGTSTESELTKRMWDKMLLENTDDVVHVLSLKGLFLYLSPSSLKVLEYDSSELVGTALSSVCHPSDIVPVTRELKDTSTGAVVSVVFRIRRKKSGYTWFESHGCLCVEQGKGRKCIILVGRERPVYAIHRHDIEAAGGLGESEMWTKLSTSGMFLFVSSNVRTLLDRAPDDLVGTSIQALMRTESVVEFGRSLEKARTGQRVTHKHEILNRKGLVLHAHTTLYPGDAAEGQKPTFLVAQTRLLKSSSRAVVPAQSSASSMGSKGRIDTTLEDSTSMGHPPGLSSVHGQELSTPRSSESAPGIQSGQIGSGPISQAGGPGLLIGSQDVALASEDNIFDELKTTRCTSWQFELRQMEKSNRLLSEELAALLSSKKKRKRRKGAGNLQRDCANCHTRVTPEWRRGPSGKRDLCNSCGLRWAKQTGRVSPRTSTRGGDPGSKASQRSNSPIHSSPLQQEVSQTQSMSNTPNLNADMDMKGNMKGDGTALPGSLGGRVTIQSMPVHNPSRGFCERGDRVIRRIINGEEG